MPQRTLGERVRRAKRQGEPATLKRSELRGSSARSAHRAKKSSQLAGEASPARGISGEKVLREARAAAYEKRVEREARPPNAKGVRQKMGPRGSSPEGRKKAPSQAGIKRAGGPFKRSRLHGG